MAFGLIFRWLWKNTDPLYIPTSSPRRAFYPIPTHTLADLDPFDRQSGVFIIAKLHFFDYYWSWASLLLSIYRALWSCPFPTWALYPSFFPCCMIFLYMTTFICHMFGNISLHFSYLSLAFWINSHCGSFLIIFWTDSTCEKINGDILKLF